MFTIFIQTPIPSYSFFQLVQFNVQRFLIGWISQDELLKARVGYIGLTSPIFLQQISKQNSNIILKYFILFRSDRIYSVKVIPFLFHLLDRNYSTTSIQKLSYTVQFMMFKVCGIASLPWVHPVTLILIPKMRGSQFFTQALNLF